MGQSITATLCYGFIPCEEESYECINDILENYDSLQDYLCVEYDIQDADADIDICYCGSSADSTYIICIGSSQVTTYGSYPEIFPADYHIEPSFWRTMLYESCKLIGIEFVEPAMILSCSWD